ncbi:hypothetical protein [Butyrivibrio fibrisolvens]|nr:hypothetical protein [Butyrivibrio fibrisolvens]
MINNEITTTKGMESAQKALEQAKNRVAVEKKHTKVVLTMGGFV